MRGAITVDGHPKDQATFNRVSGYVEQVHSKAISILKPRSAYHHGTQCRWFAIGSHWVNLSRAPCSHPGMCICALTFSHLSAPVHPGSQLSNRVCMLVQFDIHSPASTVKEALNFSAELRLEGVDAKQRKAFVGEVGSWHQPPAPVLSDPGSSQDADYTASCKGDGPSSLQELSGI